MSASAAETSGYDALRAAMGDYFIRDGAIRSRDCVYLVFQRRGDRIWTDAPQSRIAWRYGDAAAPWGFEAFDGCYGPRCAVLSPDGPFLLLGEDGGVVRQDWTGGAARAFDVEDPMPDTRQPAIESLRVIDGAAYCTGVRGLIARRERPGAWRVLAREEAPILAPERGFWDLDGFSADEIYACGRKGQLARYDGSAWRVIDTGSEEDLTSVRRAGDRIMVGGEKGVLLIGRGDRFQRLRLCSDKILDLAWYNDRLYVAQPYGRFTVFDGGALLAAQKTSPGGWAERGAAVDFGGAGLKPSIEFLRVGGGLLLAAGDSAAMVFDGRAWRVLYGPPRARGGGAL